jgi:hypothetical protein
MRSSPSNTASPSHHISRWRPGPCFARNVIAKRGYATRWALSTPATNACHVTVDRLLSGLCVLGMAVVDRAAHLSLVLDLSPPSWAAAAAAVDNDDGDEALPLSAFLAQLLAFVHAHLAGKAENTLAVFGALPGRAAVLYSSADAADTHGVALPAPDADSYQPFKVVDAALMGRVFAELDALDDDDVERACCVPDLPMYLRSVNRTPCPRRRAVQSPVLFVPPVPALAHAE